MLKTALLHGKHSKRTIRARGQICQIMSRAAARAVQAIAGIFISANRLKYPMVRKRLLDLWRRTKNQVGGDPVKAWAAIQADPILLRQSYQKCVGAADLCVPDGMR
jgi:hypothetical protein